MDDAGVTYRKSLSIGTRELRVHSSIVSYYYTVVYSSISEGRTVGGAQRPTRRAWLSERPSSPYEYE